MGWLIVRHIELGLINTGIVTILCFTVDIRQIDVSYVSFLETVIVFWHHYRKYSTMTPFTRCWRSCRVRSFIRIHDAMLMFDLMMLSYVYALIAVSPYPVDLVGHCGWNRYYLVVKSLCVLRSPNEARVPQDRIKQWRMGCAHTLHAIEPCGNGCLWAILVSLYAKIGLVVVMLMQLRQWNCHGWHNLHLH